MVLLFRVCPKKPPVCHCEERFLRRSNLRCFIWGDCEPKIQASAKLVLSVCRKKRLAMTFLDRLDLIILSIQFIMSPLQGLILVGVSFLL